MSTTAVAASVATSVRTPRMSGVKILFSWLGISLLAFPLGGLVGWGIGGHVDSLGPALVGGAITGAGVGFVQWLFLRRDLGVGTIWIPATAVALAAGLGIGAPVVDYDTALRALVVMGAISGVPVGLAHGLLLRGKFSLWAAWMVAMPILWAVGWAVTTTGGIDVDNQFDVFGAFGATAFGILSGLLLLAGRRPQDTA